MSIESVTNEQIEAVLQEAQPVVLDFYQASCPPCRFLEPRLEQMAGVYEGRVMVYRVDIDQTPDLAERFEVTSLPTVLILQKGREAERLDGLVTGDDLRAAFERVTGA